MRRPMMSFVAIVLFLGALPARGQGLLIVDDPNVQVRLPRTVRAWPPHPRPHPLPPAISYRLKELNVEARLVDQVAQVQVSQTFVNTGSRPLEVAFVFPLPYDGAIDRMTLLIDGREHPAKLLDAREARRMYEEIVRRNRDPALLEWMGTGLFRTNVFPVPAGASRTVMLRYSQLCRNQAGLTDFLFPLGTAKYTSEAVEKVRIRATIESREDIKNIYSPTHAVEIERPDERHATVTLSRTNEMPAGDFRLLYDVGQGALSARVLSYRPDRSDAGYFLLLASPRIKAPAENDCEQDGRLGDGSFGQHERQEDRAGAGGAEDVLEQSPSRRPVQHRRLRQQRARLFVRNCSDSTTRPARPPWDLSTGFTPAAARTSTLRCRPPWANCRTRSGPAT